MTENENLLEESTASIESIVESDMKSLTLEKAIEHCDNAAKRYDMMNMLSCAAEERQFADWFRELQEYRNHGDALMNRYSQEVEVLLRLQTALEDILKECSAKAAKAGEKAKKEMEVIRENKESWRSNND